MTQQPQNNATPEDIEAALQDLRTSVGAPPPEPPAEEPRRKRKRRGNWGRFLVLLILAAVAGALAVLFIPALNQRQATADGEARARLAALETRLDRLASELARDDQRKAVRELAERLEGLTGRIDALEKRPAEAAGGVAPERVAALEGEIAALRNRFAALEARLSQPATPPPAPTPSEEPPVPPVPGEEPPAPLPVVPAAPPADVSRELAALDQRLSAIEDSLPAPEVFTSLDERVSALENADPNVSQRNAALALIVARLSQAVSEGRPFALELAALQEAAPDLIDAASLQPYAERGLPPVSVLAARLEALDRDIREAADEDRGGDWFDRLWRGITGLVVVRTDGETPGTEPEDRLERAIWRARAGDLRAAATEIGALTGHAAEAAAVWLGDARARLAVEDALGAASNRILQDLARTTP